MLRPETKSNPGTSPFGPFSRWGRFFISLRVEGCGPVCPYLHGGLCYPVGGVLKVAQCGVEGDILNLAVNLLLFSVFSFKQSEYDVTYFQCLVLNNMNMILRIFSMYYLAAGRLLSPAAAAVPRSRRRTQTTSTCPSCRRRSCRRWRGRTRPTWPHP